MNHLSRWKPYQKYKPSGVGWLGEIPIHWDVKRVRYLFRVTNGSTPSSSIEEYWDGDIVWITPDDLGRLSSYLIFDSSKHITQNGYQNCGTTLVPKGSIVLSTRAPIGHIGIANVDLCTNQGCRCLVIKNSQISSKFYYYLLVAARTELQKLGNGTTFQELGKSELLNLYLVYPEISEQRAIAAYLDRETAKIDALIAKKQRLIELLQEKRTALISQAVTKGLDPNVPMKDSGMEWLGQVPAHWEIRRNKWIFKEIDERSEYGNEELLSVSHITGVTTRSEKDVNMFMAESLEGYKKCQPGDLVINTMWAWMGALGISRLHGIVSPSYNVYRLRNNRNFNPKYLDYLYRTPQHILEITRYSNGVWSSRLRLYPDEFFLMSTPQPPYEEQIQIVDFIDKQTKARNILAQKAEIAIERLREYRTALISGAVTGKIYLLDMVPQEDI